MNKKKYIISIFFVIILVITGIILYNFYEKQLLKKEINNLQKLDISRDKFNNKLITTGSYRVIEESIKNFLNEYAVSYQNILKIKDDKKFTSLLTAINYKNDGDNFQKSIEYVNNMKINFDKDIDRLIKYSNEDNIKGYIDDKNLSSYYINLYNDLMLDNDMSNEFLNSRLLLEDYKIEMDNLFNNVKEVFNFLNTNKGNWEINEDKVMFKTEELVNNYNLLIQKIKNS